MTDEPVVLPDAVRQRVLALASDELGALADVDVPAPLRPFARFAPAKRAHLAAAALAAALEDDEPFRHRVAARARKVWPDAADAEPDAGTDPVAAAVLAYLSRPQGWPHVVAAAAASTRAAADPADVAARQQRLENELAQQRRLARDAERERRRAVDEARTQAQAHARELRRLEAALRKAEERASVAEGRQAAERARAAKEIDTAARREKRLRTRIAELEADLAAGRSTARDARAADETRLRVLLDTLADAAAGLRRELALGPVPDRPADTVTDPVDTADERGVRLPAEDVARLAAVLAAPQAHLIVDGYNVTKTGYGTLSLEEQRARLVQGLQALHARTGAEITCVFDGADVGRVPAVAARGVRVRFSPAGRTADELIAEFLRAEPPGRRVLVASSDHEVVDAALAAGAYAVPSAGLLALLER